MNGSEQHLSTGRDNESMKPVRSTTKGRRCRPIGLPDPSRPAEVPAALRDPVPQNHDDLGTRLNLLFEHLQRIEAVVLGLQEQKPTKEWYTPAEVAVILDKAPFTVREWARLGRIHAEKRSGRGRTGEWRISNAEVTRVCNFGLLPLPDYGWRHPALANRSYSNRHDAGKSF